MRLPSTPALLGGLTWLLTLSLSLADDKVDWDTTWDYAPDFSKDEFPPYPDLKNKDGSNITVANLRGVHLFGWKGCHSEEVKSIKEAYNDFYTLAQQPEVYNNIDWKSQAATDFWGPADGPNKVPDDTRKEIQQIFAAAQQVYSYPWTWQPPWLGWRQLWIEVRCSDSKSGKSSSDPDNFCGDAKTDDNNCPIGQPPVGGGKRTLEAFSDPNPDDGRYSRITFCNDFFKLDTFKDAVDKGKKLPATQRTNLEHWNNRARCFFHEVTHLDYFMNADGKSPYVSDLEVQYNVKGKSDWYDCYGPYNAKVLRNYVDPDPKYSGYYTQRNADNYAYFALAKYVEKQIKKYPSSPSPGRKKPLQEPRDAKSHAEPAVKNGASRQGQDKDLLPGAEQDPPDTKYPGCGDKAGKDISQASIVASISSHYGPHATQTQTQTKTQTQPTATPKATPKCKQGEESSIIPYNVFDGSAGTIYGKFCDAVNKNSKDKLTWTVNSSGDQVKKTSRRRSLSEKRTPPPDPGNYKSTIELDWAPAKGTCNTKCSDAFVYTVESPCGHQGSQMNNMAKSASIDVGCGTYSYKITDPAPPKPKPEPKPVAPSLGKQSCYASDAFGKHGDIQPDWVENYSLFACAKVGEKKDLKSGDTVNWHTKTNGVDYTYNVWWKDGCTSTVNPMNGEQPISDKNAACMDLFLNNYKNCLNGGVGGTITVGCLEYEFKPSTADPGKTS